MRMSWSWATPTLLSSALLLSGCGTAVEHFSRDNSVIAPVTSTTPSAITPIEVSGTSEAIPVEASAQKSRPKVEPRLAKQLAKKDRVDVVLSAGDVKAAAKQVRAAGGKGVQAFPFTGVVTANIPSNSLDGLFELGDVVTAEAADRVEPPMLPVPEAPESDAATSALNSGFEGLNSSASSPPPVFERPAAVNPQLASVIAATGITGSTDGDPNAYTDGDISIAVIDTGVNEVGSLAAPGKVAAHVDFSPTYGGCTNEDPTRWDGYGHGTYVASAIAGEGVGVAPGARIIDLRVWNCNNWVGNDGFERAFQWIADNKDAYNIVAVNMSFSAGVNSLGTSSFSRAANRLTAIGVQTIASAGNYGPKKGTIYSPADAKFAGTTAAVSTGAGGTWGAYFSSVGPTTDGRNGIDFAAYGIHSLLTSPSGQLRQMAGTSFAAPYVAGAYALLAAAGVPASSGQACPAGDTSAECADGVVDSTMSTPGVDLLKSTATPLLPAVYTGNGVVNAAKALSSVANGPAVTSEQSSAATVTMSGADVVTVKVDASTGPVGITVAADTPYETNTAPTFVGMCADGSYSPVHYAAYRNADASYSVFGDPAYPDKRMLNGVVPAGSCVTTVEVRIPPHPWRPTAPFQGAIAVSGPQVGPVTLWTPTVTEGSVTIKRVNSTSASETINVSGAGIESATAELAASPLASVTVPVNATPVALETGWRNVMVDTTAGRVRIAVPVAADRDATFMQTGGYPGQGLSFQDFVETSSGFVTTNNAFTVEAAAAFAARGWALPQAGWGRFIGSEFNTNGDVTAVAPIYTTTGAAGSESVFVKAVSMQGVKLLASTSQRIGPDNDVVPTGVLLYPNGERVRLVDLAPAVSVHTDIEQPSSPTIMDGTTFLGPDDRYLAVRYAGGGGGLHVFDLQSRTLAWSLPARHFRNGTPAFSPYYIDETSVVGTTRCGYASEMPGLPCDGAMYSSSPIT